MSNEYLVVTVSGSAFIVEEAFEDGQSARNLLASGVGNYILHGYD